MNRNTKFLAALLAAISGAILGASTLCAWAVANGASPRWRVLFRVLCHGIPERCLNLFGVPMPICARCTAIYGGLAAGIALFWILPSLSEIIARRTLFLATLPLAVDGLTQLVRLRESTNALRLDTGLIAGAAFAFWALSAVENRVLDSPSRSPQTSNGFSRFAQRATAAGHHPTGERVGKDGQVHPLPRR